jgi:[ribosomal protein S5]-alanine N-acetyltransferase
MIDCGSFVLRPLKLSDKDAMAQYANNIRIWQNVRDVFPHPYTMRDAVAFIRLCQEQDPVCNFCIEVEGSCTGVIGYIRQRDVYRLSAEVGYWLGEPFWGRGIMSRAVTALTQHIFADTDIVRVYAGVFAWNTPSMRVLERAGYKLECVFEQAVFKNGVLTDEYRYGKLKA